MGVTIFTFYLYRPQVGVSKKNRFFGLFSAPWTQEDNLKKNIVIFLSCPIKELKKTQKFWIYHKNCGHSFNDSEFREKSGKNADLFFSGALGGGGVQT